MSITFTFTGRREHVKEKDGRQIALFRRTMLTLSMALHRFAVLYLPLALPIAVAVGSSIMQIVSRRRKAHSVSAHSSARALHAAARMGSVVDVRRLLQAGQCSNAQDIKGFTALHLAAARGHTPVVAALLDQTDIQVDLPSNTGASPLVAAAGNGHVETVRLLLDDGRADPALVGLRGRGALHGASLYGHHAVVSALLADPRVPRCDPSDESGRTPLTDAARKGRVAVLRVLLEAGALDGERIRKAATVAEEAGQSAAAKVLYEAAGR